MDPDLTVPPAITTAPEEVRPTFRAVYVGRELHFEDFRLAKGRTSLGRATGGVRIADVRVSRQHAVVTFADDRVVIKNASGYGTFVNGAQVEERELNDGDVVRLGDSFFVFRWMPATGPSVPADELLGRAPSMDAVRHLVKVAASTRAMVLILGETGTGKELVSRALHHESGRKGPLVAVNCAAIPAELAESQLFGHKAGAFSGATRDSPGYFREADSGTLFLDELGELPPLLQPKLLRALDSSEIVPVGATMPVAVDVRVVCATNRDLAGDIAQHRFRGDLYARVAELQIVLPPLRHRKEDVMLLLSHFLGAGSSFSPRLVNALLCHDWPFNVRELTKIAGELRVKAIGKTTYGYKMIADRLADPGGGSQYDEQTSSMTRAAPERAPDKEMLVALLAKHEGRVSKVAEECKRSRMQVYRWLEQHGIDPHEFRKHS